MRNVVAKFQRQTGVHASIDFHGTGTPLVPEQHCRFSLFCKKLCRMRKHAQTSQVQVLVENERDFSLRR